MGTPGSLTIISGGMHGNEPAGVIALQRVLAHLSANHMQVRGRFVALAGNIAALRAGLRYIDRDLNRKWDTASVIKLLHEGVHDFAEDIEQLELLDEFERLTAGWDGPVNLLDMHTMSAKGVPFIVACETADSKDLEELLVLPGIAGLEKAIPGTTLEFFLGQGFRAVAVEGGQHDDPHAIDLLEALAWLMLAATEIVTEEQVPDLAAKRALLAAEARDMPQHVTVRYRHGVDPDDEFEMLPGYHNLQPIRAGQVLARDREGAILAPQDGWILLPLYQKAGSDGFFIGTTA